MCQPLFLALEIEHEKDNQGLRFLEVEERKKVIKQYM